jgi:hypothetical protein
MEKEDVRGLYCSSYFTHSFLYRQTSLVAVTFNDPIGRLTAEIRGMWHVAYCRWDDPLLESLGTMTCMRVSCDTTDIGESTWFNFNNTYKWAKVDRQNHIINRPEMENQPNTAIQPQLSGASE